MIRDNFRTVLNFLASLEIDKTGKAWTTGPEIKTDLDMLIEDINDAMKTAEESGFVEWMRSKGSPPYYFSQVTITSEGRVWIEK